MGNISIPPQEFIHQGLSRSYFLVSFCKMSSSKLQIKFLADYPTHKCLLDHPATCKISVKEYLFRGKRGHQNQERI